MCVFFSSPRCFGQPIVKIETVAVSKSPFTYIQKSMQVFPFEHLSTLTTTIKKERNNNANNFNNSKNVEKNLLAKYFRGFFLFHFVWMFCSGVLFYNRPNCVCVCVSWLSRQANKSFWIARISFSLSHWFFMVVRSVLHFLDYSNAFTADEKTTKSTNISAFNRVSAGNYCRMD